MSEEAPMNSIIAALEAHAPIPRTHRDGSPSDEPGDTICRWCRVYAGIDHDDDCPITVARSAPSPLSLDVDRLAEALRDSGVGCSVASEGCLHDDCLDDHGAAELRAALEGAPDDPK